MNKSITALVPMRHTSERVPGKNYRPFAGRPLYHHVIETLLNCSEVSAVLIDTDSPVILDDAARNFPSVLLVERPEKLRDGTVPMNDVLLHDIAMHESDYYLQTHSTNPLLRSETVSRAIRDFLAAEPTYDSLFSVTPMQTRLWTRDGFPVNHDPNRLLRTQDLEPIMEENSSLYIFTARNLRRTGNRIGDRPLMFQIDREEAWDIDEELDFTVAETLFLKRRMGSVVK